MSIMEMILKRIIRISARYMMKIIALYVVNAVVRIMIRLKKMDLRKMRIETTKTTMETWKNISKQRR